MTQEEILEAVEDAHRHDFQVGIHANGDVAAGPCTRRTRSREDVH